MKNKAIDIDYAIPELTRPPVYTSMKYWGKKPHNVWYEYIKNYVPNGGIFLDPFAGSGMSGIEAVRAGKKAVCLDINPLTTFLFDVYCSNFNIDSFHNEVNRILKIIKNSNKYKQCFLYNDKLILHNAKYKNGECYEVCFVSEDEKIRITSCPSKADIDIIKKSQTLKVPFEFPKKKFRDSIAFSPAFKKKIKDSYNNLFSRRNLIVLSLIFHEILHVENRDLQKQLLLAFIQSVHLCTKMCVPRNKKTCRDFSTSWGRAAYFLSSSEMEMNPLLVFYHNCIGKQSVSSTLKALIDYAGPLRGMNITLDNNIDFSADIDLWYGIKDSRTLSKLFSSNSIDFVLTDPPYGGLVQYLDLSYVWLAWLEIYNPIYSPLYELEITVNRDKTINDFRIDLSKVLSEISMKCKDEAKVVLTFNNKKLPVWNALLGAISDSEYLIENVVYQQNLRSGESNVNDKYGSSSCDFYIRCVKNKSIIKKDKNFSLDSCIVNEIKAIIQLRCEPTPYQILLNGLLTKLAMLPIDLNYKKQDLQKIIFAKKSYFEIIKNGNSMAGEYWWIKNEIYNIDSPNTLTNRIKKQLNIIFQAQDSISDIELMTIIYKEFPNELSPDKIIVRSLIENFADKKGKLWIKKEL